MGQKGKRISIGTLALGMLMIALGGRTLVIGRISDLYYGSLSGTEAYIVGTVCFLLGLYGICSAFKKGYILYTTKILPLIIIVITFVITGLTISLLSKYYYSSARISLLLCVAATLHLIFFEILAVILTVDLNSTKYIKNNSKEVPTSHPPYRIR